VKRLALLSLVAVILVGCSDEGRPLVTLRTGVLRAQDYLPYFVIQEQGFDKRHGLRFVEQTFEGGAAVLAGLADGLLDAGPTAGSVPVLTAAEQGWIPDKIVVVAANCFADREHPGVGLLVAAHIRDWKDLRGQKIATNARNSIATAAVDGRLKQEGVDDYAFVEIPFANMGLAMAGGNVAGAGMNEPYLTQSLLRRDGRLLAWVVGGPPFERMEFSLIVFGAAFYRSNPQGVKAYLRAHLAAVPWINDNPQEARRLLARRTSLGRDVAERINLLHWPRDARNAPELLDQMQQALVKARVLKAPIPARHLYDETLLTEVLKEKG
jgi:NitT/TauT family transport system substrate-binding protein